MLRIALPTQARGPARLLVLGAHADDIEIGCGGTILRLISEQRELEVTWVVFCAPDARAAEARASAEAFLEGARDRRIVVHDYRDGYLPYEAGRVKDAFEVLKREVEPDLILTHYREDRHQDHRIVSDLTWNTWRNHMILEYEIPKYDGDLGAPSFFVPVSAEQAATKADTLLECFASQRDKHWFTRDLFLSLMRLRGMECNSASGYAEAFYCRKAVLAG
jgi:LmbE family N-acetylglucosaminyl deacetylase